MNIHPVVSAFTDKKVTDIIKIYTCHGDKDFRVTLILTCLSGEKLVIKLADNGFTTPEHLKMQQKCADSYRSLGYYCPRIMPALSGEFPRLEFENRLCTAWSEEFSLYRSADSFDRSLVTRGGFYNYIDDAIVMNAKVAAQYYDYTELPSGYCLFETFSKDDPECEVFENAHMWKAAADALPPEFTPQTERIWQRWLKDCEALEQVYHLLPHSVFQADINDTNCLLNERGEFVGVYDFNIAGRDVFLNYLFREIPSVMTDDSYEPSGDYTVDCIKHALKVSGRVYKFSDSEKKYAGLLFRCIKPLYYFWELKEAGSDRERISKLLDKTEYTQTREIDFSACMK